MDDDGRGVFIMVLQWRPVLGYPLIAESNAPAITATAESFASTLIMAGGITQQWVGKHCNPIGIIPSCSICQYTWSNYRHALLISQPEFFPF